MILGDDECGLACFRQGDRGRLRADPAGRAAEHRWASAVPRAAAIGMAVLLLTTCTSKPTPRGVASPAASPTAPKPGASATAARVISGPTPFQQCQPFGRVFPD